MSKNKEVSSVKISSEMHKKLKKIALDRGLTLRALLEQIIKQTTK